MPILFSSLWILRVIASTPIAPWDNWPVKSDMRIAERPAAHRVLRLVRRSQCCWVKAMHGKRWARYRCPKNLTSPWYSPVSATEFWPKQTIRCGACQCQRFPVEAGRGFFWKLIKPLTCKVRKVISTIPQGMPYAQLRNHYGTWLSWVITTPTYARRNSTDSPRYSKCSDVS